MSFKDAVGKSMCGINGFNWPDRTLIGEMNRTIKNRGPDADGVYTDDTVSLGHVRLAILDRSPRANQPMRNDTDDLFLVYNGEIYNFVALKNDLEQKGITFTTRSDTEVLLKGYECYGSGFFPRLNGMFAFCLYDPRKKQFLLGRDRLGIKPLYYAFDGEHFVFSSEIKALVKNGRIVPVVGKDLMYAYLLTDNIPGESLFENIHALPPGRILKFDITNKKISFENYLEKTALIDAATYLSPVRESALVDTLDRLLHDAIKNQIVADVEVGTICSGGLDSSLVTAIACRYAKNIKIFHVRVQDDELDESRYAKRVAEFLGRDIIIEDFGPENFRNSIEECIRFEDLPLSYAHSVGIYLIAKKAHECGVPVLLSGEGSDELFGGYGHYRYYYRKLIREQRMEQLCAYPGVRRLCRYLTNFWFTDDFPHKKIRELDSTFAEEWLKLVSSYPGVPWENYKLEAQASYERKCDFITDQIEQKTVSYILKDLDYYLIPLLRRADRMSMACGVEMRVPFLDNSLLAFAMNLPLRYKIAGTMQKYLLKKVAERYLPKDIVYREKNGFIVPLGKWQPATGSEAGSFRREMLSKALFYYAQEFSVKTPAGW